jgi:biopolymer transport protein TolQ
MSEILFSLPLASIWEAFTTSDGFGKGIVVIQLAMSVGIWSLMIGKWLDLRDKIKESERFRKFFTGTDMLLGYYYSNQRVQVSKNPLINVYIASSKRIVRELNNLGLDVRTLAETRGQKLSKGAITLVKGAAEEELSVQSLLVEKYMGVLGAGASLATLLGLLGTVVGVLFAFQSMGAKGSVNLSEIAPGLSSAMLTTVVGLVVAIPSIFGYNILVGSIRQVNIILDGFTDELLGRLLSEFDDDE